MRNKTLAKNYIFKTFVSYYSSSLTFKGYGNYYIKQFKKNTKLLIFIELIHFYYRKPGLRANSMIYKEYQKNSKAL